MPINYIVDSEKKRLKEETFDPTRIQLAVVKDTRSPKRDGSIKVWIPRQHSNEDDKTEWIVAHCASSNIYGTSLCEKDTGKIRSFGEWKPMPEKGNFVFLFYPQMPNGSNATPYWFSCPLDYRLIKNFPGVSLSYEENLVKGKEVEKDDYTTETFKKQGLDKDKLRGIYKETTQRDISSHIYGYKSIIGHSVIVDDGWNTKENSEIHDWSVDEEEKNDDKKDEPTIDVTKDWTSELKEDINKELQRFDGGFKFRTRSGTTLLIMDCGTVYTINADGTAWTEVSDDGHLYGYSKYGIHIASDGDIDLSSKKDINIEAKGNLNIKVGKDKDEQDEENKDEATSTQQNAETEESVGLDDKKAGFVRIEAKADVKVKVADGGGIETNGSISSGGKKLGPNAEFDNVIIKNATINTLDAINASIQGVLYGQVKPSNKEFTDKIEEKAPLISYEGEIQQGTTDDEELIPVKTIKGQVKYDGDDDMVGEDKEVKSICSKVPTHEPYAEHNKNKLYPQDGNEESSNKTKNQLEQNDKADSNSNDLYNDQIIGSVRNLSQSSSSSQSNTMTQTTLENSNILDKVNRISSSNCCGGGKTISSVKNDEIQFTQNMGVIGLGQNDLTNTVVSVNNIKIQDSFGRSTTNVLKSGSSITTSGVGNSIDLFEAPTNRNNYLILNQAEYNKLYDYSLTKQDLKNKYAYDVSDVDELKSIDSLISVGKIVWIDKNSKGTSDILVKTQYNENGKTKTRYVSLYKGNYVLYNPYNGGPTNGLLLQTLRKLIAESKMLEPLETLVHKMPSPRMFDMMNEFVSSLQTATQTLNTIESIGTKELKPLVKPLVKLLNHIFKMFGFILMMAQCAQKGVPMFIDTLKDTVESIDFEKMQNDGLMDNLTNLYPILQKVYPMYCLDETTRKTYDLIDSTKKTIDIVTNVAMGYKDVVEKYSMCSEAEWIRQLQKFGELLGLDFSLLDSNMNYSVFPTPLQMIEDVCNDIQYITHTNKYIYADDLEQYTNSYEAQNKEKTRERVNNTRAMDVYSIASAIAYKDIEGAFYDFNHMNQK